MDSEIYEELCRLFVAQEVGLSVEDIKSVAMPNPSRPDLPSYSHQIDLFWETGDSIALYLNIANAKWRGTAKVDQPEILLLQQVRQQTAAHKALMLTNVGFTAGAVAAAKDHGIALHIVKPAFDVTALPRGNRHAALAALKALAASGPSSKVYSHKIEHRGLDSTQGLTASRPAAPTHSGPIVHTRVVPTPVPRTVGSVTTRTSGGGGDVAGPGGSGPITRGGGGFSKG